LSVLISISSIGDIMHKKKTPLWNGVWECYPYREFTLYGYSCDIYI